MSIELARSATLRYGENPHQRASLYGRFFDVVEPLHGKELSFNNIVDVQAALALIVEFAHADRTAVAILKHNTPCGVGVGATPVEAYRRAFATDPESPFGGIIVASRPFDLALASAVDEIFTEVLIAPGFDDDALALLQKKKNRRLLRFHPERVPPSPTCAAYPAACSCREPTARRGSAWVPRGDRSEADRGQLRALALAGRWSHAKSNAVFASSDGTSRSARATARRRDPPGAREKAARA
jgi:phosphoribosylaminoimidazolecarboxamide formyltransferase/IMP cyclohydrolase